MVESKPKAAGCLYSAIPHTCVFNLRIAAKFCAFRDSRDVSQISVSFCPMSGFDFEVKVIRLEIIHSTVVV